MYHWDYIAQLDFDELIVPVDAPDVPALMNDIEINASVKDFTSMMLHQHLFVAKVKKT